MLTSLAGQNYGRVVLLGRAGASGAVSTAVVCVPPLVPVSRLRVGR